MEGYIGAVLRGWGLRGFLMAHRVCGNKADSGPEGGGMGKLWRQG